MAGNYEALKQTIDSNIKQNRQQQITGPVLNSVLNQIVSSIGENATFAGIATPSTNPGTPDQNVFYLAMEPGIYVNFDNTALPTGYIRIFYTSNNAWARQSVRLPINSYNVSQLFPTLGVDGGNKYTKAGAISTLYKNLLQKVRTSWIGLECVYVDSITGLSRHIICYNTPVYDPDSWYDDINYLLRNKFAMNIVLEEGAAVYNEDLKLPVDKAHASRVRSSSLVFANIIKTIEVASGYQVYFYRYDSFGKFLKYTGWLSSLVTPSVSYTNELLRMMVKKEDNSAITVDEAYEALQVTYEKPYVAPEPELIYNNEISADSVQSSKKISTDANVIEGTINTELRIFNVAPGDSYRISGKLIGYKIMDYAVYSSDSFTSENAIQKGNLKSDTETPWDVDELVTIQENAKYLAVTVYVTPSTIIESDQIKVYRGLSAEQYIEQISPVLIDLQLQSNATGRLSTTLADKTVNVVLPYSEDNDIQINLAPCGPNSIVQLKSFLYLNRTADFLSNTNGSYSRSFNSPSDWISPWKYGLTTGGASYTTTGGWHTWNGTQSGDKATGRTESIKVYVNSKLLSDDVTDILSNDIRVVVTNYIQAGNTYSEDTGKGAEALKEEVTYHFKEGRMYVSVIATALDAITIGHYYGTGQCFNPDITMFASGGRVYNFQTDSGQENGARERISKMQCKRSTGDMVIITLDDTGLGVQHGLNPDSGNKRYCFTEPYGKSYFSLIGDSKLSLQANESVWWSGCYEFTAITKLV